MEKNNEAEKEEIAKGIIKIILLGESGVGKSALKI